MAEERSRNVEAAKKSPSPGRAVLTVTQTVRQRMLAQSIGNMGVQHFTV